MAKIIMMRGLPASGKSTQAKFIVDNGGDFVRVSKDNLRTMLHFDKWNGRNEGTTRDIEREIVRAAIKAGKNVVIDDTNLGENHKESWSQLAKELGVNFEVKALITPWDVCVERDAAQEREVPVGRTVIVNMALQYGLYTPAPAKSIVICDLDGTLCDTSWRVHYVEQEPKDWKRFFAGIPNDPVRLEVKEQLEAYFDAGHPIVFMSGRSEDYLDVTKEWLSKHWRHEYLTLIMRKQNDTRPDHEVKQSLYETYLKHYPIEVVLDDRPSVIRMWREQGLEVKDVGNGVEF